MKDKKIDLKMIIIVVLALFLLYNFYAKNLKKYFEFKNSKEPENIELLKQIDSLKLSNKNISILLEKNVLKLDSVYTQINVTNNRIKNLEKKIHENKVYVNSLNANGVADALSNYIEGKNNK